MHFCLKVPFPPNLGLSLQYLHFPQSDISVVKTFDVAEFPDVNFSIFLFAVDVLVELVSLFRPACTFEFSTFAKFDAIPLNITEHVFSMIGANECPLSHEAFQRVSVHSDSANFFTNDATNTLL